ncbi:MAG: hypothetical protein H0W09_00900 [Solirubrobacterales bacterium]|nr:hypothetical protein [Solirubrobacterales bacterium]
MTRSLRWLGRPHARLLSLGLALLGASAWFAPTSASAVERASVIRAVERIVDSPNGPPGASVLIRKHGRNMHISRVAR